MKKSFLSLLIALVFAVSVSFAGCDKKEAPKKVEKKVEEKVEKKAEEKAENKEEKKAEEKAPAKKAEGC